MFDIAGHLFRLAHIDAISSAKKNGNRLTLF